MANCGTLAGLSLGCRAEAGIKKVLIGVYPTATTWFSDTDGTVDGITGVTAYDYELNPETSNGTFNPKANRQTNTIYYEQNVLLALNNLTVDARNEIQLLGTNPKLIMFVQTVDNVWWMYGERLGMAVVDSEGTTGTAPADFRGFNMNFSSNEPELPYVVETAVITDITA